MRATWTQDQAQPLALLCAGGRQDPSWRSSLQLWGTGLLASRGGSSSPALGCGDLFSKWLEDILAGHDSISSATVAQKQPEKTMKPMCMIIFQ